MTFRRFVAWVVVACIFASSAGVVQAMSGATYQIPWDSISGGGVDTGASTNYQLHDTVGGQSTGDGSSVNYQNRAGYRAGETATSTGIVPVCGNGVLQAGEQCDNGVNNGACPKTCSASCTTNVCGGGGGGGGGGGNNNNNNNNNDPNSPPIISNVKVINLTKTSATIIWDTDKAANSFVSFGPTKAYENGTLSDANFVVSHSISLSNLLQNALYHFQIVSSDQGQHTATYTDQTFTTSDAQVSPVISNVQVMQITDFSALVTWETDVDASSLVRFGLTQQYDQTATSLGSVKKHAVQLSGLQQLQTYQFAVLSTDAFGNAAQSPNGSFMTLKDATPPTNVSNLTATPGNTTVTLNWKNPGSDFVGTTIRRKLGAYPGGPSDGVEVYTGAGTNVVDVGLTNGITYYYAAFAFDANKNFSSGALANAIPQGQNNVPQLPPPLPPPQQQQQPGSGNDVPPNVNQGSSSHTSTPSSSTQHASGILVASFSARRGLVSLNPNAQRQVGILVAEPVHVVLELKEFSFNPSLVTIEVGGAMYAMQGASSTFETDFSVDTVGVVPVVLKAMFADASLAQQSYEFQVQSGGKVVEQMVGGLSNQGVSQARVQLFQDQDGAWVPYGALTVTSDSGDFGFVVPNGRYYAEVEKEGYEKTVTTPLRITQNVYRERIPLVKLPMIASIPQNATPEQKAAILAKNAQEQIAYQAKHVRAVLGAPEVQAVNQVASPMLVAVSIVNTASSISLFNFLAYLQYLFAQPILLIGRRKKLKWGVVFNSLTKMPVDLAIVRLIETKTGRVIQTKVTDRMGRFAFFVKKGLYSLEVVKPGFVFPTEYLKEKAEDVAFLDLYHGVQIEMTEDGILTPNVPLDPVTATETPRRVLLRKFSFIVRHGFALSTILLAMIAVVITPGMLTAALLMAQVGAYLLFRRMALPKKAKSWGMIFDAKTREPVGNAIVRIFDKKFNKLLETQVTNRNGRYGFFARKNIYYIVVEKVGYQKFTTPDIDLLAKDEALLDENIALQQV